MTKKIFLILSVIFLTEIRASQINVQLLIMRVNGFSSQICDGYCVNPDSIESKLDFIPYDCKPIKWDPERFSLLISESASTANLALEKFGHNRLNAFVNDCNILFNSGALEEKERFALFTLLAHIKHKIDCLLKDIDSIIEEESRIPDEQFSFFFDSHQVRSRSDSEESTTSTHHISSCGSVSEGSEHSPKKTDEHGDMVFSQINLDGKNLQESSFSNYRNKIPKSPLPICISCNLQTITKSQISDLQIAIQEIENTQRLVEVIFQKGSSIKFNLLFAFLKQLAENRPPENPITIVYSTTSDSQKAYKKLSTLQGVVQALPTIDTETETDLHKLKSDSIHTCQRIRVDFSDSTLKRIKEVFNTGTLQ
jgi:hypothetical protein